MLALICVLLFLLGTIIDVRPYDQVPDNEMWAERMSAVSRPDPNTICIILHDHVQSSEALEYGCKKPDSLDDSTEQCSMPTSIATVT